MSLLRLRPAQGGARTLLAAVAAFVLGFVSALASVATYRAGAH